MSVQPQNSFLVWTENTLVSALFSRTILKHPQWKYSTTRCFGCPVLRVGCSHLLFHEDLPSTYTGYKASIQTHSRGRFVLFQGLESLHPRNKKCRFHQGALPTLCFHSYRVIQCSDVRSYTIDVNSHHRTASIDALKVLYHETLELKISRCVLLRLAAQRPPSTAQYFDGPKSLTITP